jgi:hypothetical protein
VGLKDGVGSMADMEDDIAGWDIWLQQVSVCHGPTPSRFEGMGEIGVRDERTASSPSPLRAILSPFSVPGSIWNSTLFLSLTTFSPLHFLHLSVSPVRYLKGCYRYLSLSRNLDPSPSQSGQVTLIFPTNPGPSYLNQSHPEQSPTQLL